MLPTIVDVHILSGSRVGQKVRFLDPDLVRFGRHPVSEITFSRTEELTVSHHHAELRREAGGYVLHDAGSTNGTLLYPGGEAVRSLALSGDTEIELGRGGPRCRILLSTAAAHPGPPGPSLGETTLLLPHRVAPVEGVDGEPGPLTQTFGRYLLTGRLGAGGMAELYAARQRGLGGFDREVALKLIRPELYEVANAASMFLDEARIISEISHPNVVQVHDAGEHEGVLFIAMEYLRGVTLLHLALQAQEPGEGLPPDLVAALIAQAAAGLHAAHELRDRAGQLRNVVHRDVSPQNLMLTQDGLVKVIDFGVARAEGRLAGTDAGQLKGKYGYMSPEQVAEQPVDRRSDVFSLGVMLFELCSGRRLFLRDNDAATLWAVSRGEAPPLRQLRPQVSALLERVVQQALAVDPAARPQTAAALAEWLHEVVAEAGGRFATSALVVRYLISRGLSLTGPPPKPLSRRPVSAMPRRRAPVVFAATPVPVTKAKIDTEPGSRQTTEAGPEAAIEAHPEPAWIEAMKETRPQVPLGDPLSLPPPGEVLTTRSAAGQPLFLRSVVLDAETDRQPVPLLLSDVPGLLPAPLLLSIQAGSLALEVDRESRSDAVVDRESRSDAVVDRESRSDAVINRESRSDAVADRESRSDAVADRPPGLYHDAHRPSTRLDSYFFPPADDASFDLGHRKSRVLTIRYHSVVPDLPQAPPPKDHDSDEGALPPMLRVTVAALGLDLHVPGAPRQVVVLHTLDAAGGAIHATCIAVY